MNTRTFDRYSRLSAIICLTVFLAACGGGGATKTATAEWTWMSGNYTRNLNGVYGTQGVAAAGNVPGARYAPASWMDSGGNLWLFGGYGYDSTGVTGQNQLNDLWEFSPATKEWTWVSGSNIWGAIGDYKALQTNFPGARDSSISWIDGGGNLWLFGGFGYDSYGASGDLNDLWVFNPTTKEWTWISGSNAGDDIGFYGTQGAAAATSFPGARNGSVSWIDKSGNLWLFGGIGYDSTGAAGDLNDLWLYRP